MERFSFDRPVILDWSTALTAGLIRMCASPRSILWLIIASGERENICCDRDLASKTNLFTYLITISRTKWSCPAGEHLPWSWLWSRERRQFSPAVWPMWSRFGFHVPGYLDGERWLDLTNSCIEITPVHVIQRPPH
jgi:hypothetical protein